MKIQNFISAIKDGVRPNLYRIEIDGLPENFTFLCKAAQVPSKTIGVIEVPYLNMKLPIGGDVTFEDWTVTVYQDKEGKIKKALEDWQEEIRANDSADGGIPEDYFKDGNVIQLDGKGNDLTNYKMIGMWPTSITAIELGYENNDQLAEYTVTFRYIYWKREK